MGKNDTGASTVLEPTLERLPSLSPQGYPDFKTLHVRGTLSMCGITIYSLNVGYKK